MQWLFAPGHEQFSQQTYIITVVKTRTWGRNIQSEWTVWLRTQIIERGKTTSAHFTSLSGHTSTTTLTNKTRYFIQKHQRLPFHNS